MFKTSEQALKFYPCFFKVMEGRNFQTKSKLKWKVSKIKEFDEDEGPIKATSWASGND